jgi:dipeptidase E
MEKSGLMDQLPKLLQKRIYAGISAGSMIVTDNLRLASQALEKGDLRDEEYNELGPPGQSSSRTLRLVNFVVRPHLNSPWFPNITIDKLSDLAEKLPLPIYAIDDQTAIQVVDGVVDVVSEGTWQLFNE